MHEQANERLSSEIDILEFIETSRVLKFIASFTLRKNQREMVRFFKSYHLDQDNLELPKKAESQSTIELLEKFDPLSS